MKPALFVVGLIVAEALRLTWFTRLPAYPDILLGMVVLSALRFKPSAGAAIGFLLGAYRDWLYGGPLGAETFVFAAVGWAVGSLGKSIYRDAAVTRATMLFLAVMARHAFLILTAGVDLTGCMLYLLHRGLPEALVTALVLPAALHILHLITRPRLDADAKTKYLEA